MSRSAASSSPSCASTSRAASAPPDPPPPPHTGAPQERGGAGRIPSRPAPPAAVCCFDGLRRCRYAAEVHISHLIFDLDDTLYPPSRGVVARVHGLISEFMVERLGIAVD